MDEKIVIAVIVGTAREKGQSIKVARWVAAYGETLPNVEIVFVDPREFTLPADGNDQGYRDERYTAITARADAFYIVVPEYNHSYSGSLKRLLDSEYENYHHKAVALTGVSDGPWGGVRACEALMPVLHRLGLSPVMSELYSPKVQDLFDENGRLMPENDERYTRNVARVYKELIWLARLLKTGRAQL